jgi:hypothetical protein
MGVPMILTLAGHVFQPCHMLSDKSLLRPQATPGLGMEADVTPEPISKLLRLLSSGSNSSK